MIDSDPNTDPRDELDWLAFCYVTGELSQADAVLFEERLQRDLDACLAVTRAVNEAREIAVSYDAPSVASSNVRPSTTANVGSAIAPRRRIESTESRGLARGRSHAAGFRRLVSATVALALLLGVVSWGGKSYRGSRSQISDAQSVVGLWSASEGMDSGLMGFDQDVIDSEVGDADVSLADDSGNDPADGLSLPSWLLAAVSVEAMLGEDEPEQN